MCGFPSLFKPQCGVGCSALGNWRAPFIILPTERGALLEPHGFIQVCWAHCVGFGLCDYPWAPLPHQLSAPHLSNLIGTISRHCTVPQTQRVKKLPEMMRKILQLGNVAVMISLPPWAQRQELRTIFSLVSLPQCGPGLLSKVDNGVIGLTLCAPSLALTKAISIAVTSLVTHGLVKRTELWGNSHGSLLFGNLHEYLRDLAGGRRIMVLPHFSLAITPV